MSELQPREDGRLSHWEMVVWTVTLLIALALILGIVQHARDAEVWSYVKPATHCHVVVAPRGGVRVCGPTSRVVRSPK